MSSVQIQDGSGIVKYRQDTGYDQYSGFTGANCITTAPMHDNANYGCSFTKRGNPTTVTTYKDPATPANGIAKTMSYDSLGNVRTVSTAGIQQSQVNYTSTTQYAYPESVIRGSGGTQLTTSFAYHNSSGMLVTTTDPNNQATTFAYDGLLRVTSVTRSADNSQITYSYSDPNVSPVTFTVTTPLQGTATLQKIATVDSLGRIVKVTAADGN